MCARRQRGNGRQEPREHATAGTVGGVSAIVAGVHFRRARAVVDQQVIISPETAAVTASTLFERAEMVEVLVLVGGRFDTTPL